MKHRVIGITGWKNSGKTTLVEKLVTLFVAQGLRVATIKHAHHTFDIDHEGTDSYRHRKAGAHEVAIVSSNRWALMHELEGEKEPPLQEVLSRLSPCDLVIVEGYKREGHDKIEVRRNDPAEALSPGDESIIAIASDTAILDKSLPGFHLDDVDAIAAFILHHLNLPKPAAR
jgi:molybdopterin-guanine dinucleotide biosynthesis adapter protein